VFTTGHYGLLDEDALAAALAVQPDVLGDRGEAGTAGSTAKTG